MEFTWYKIVTSIHGSDAFFLDMDCEGPELYFYVEFRRNSITMPLFMNSIAQEVNIFSSIIFHPPNSDAFSGYWV